MKLVSKVFEHREERSKFKTDISCRKYIKCSIGKCILSEVMVLRAKNLSTVGQD